MASSSSSTTMLQSISSALMFLTPLFALFLFVVTITHPPSTVPPHTRHQKIQTLGVYLAIGSLAALCTLEGAMGLGDALVPAGENRLGMRGRGEAAVETLVFLELEATVLYLVYEHIQQVVKLQWIIILGIELAIAVVISLTYPPSSHGSVALFLPAVLSLIFLASLLPLLGFALRVHIRKQRPSNAQIAPMIKIHTPSNRDSDASGNSLPSTTSSKQQEKVASPKSSISDLTAVNHHHYRNPCSLRNGQVDASTLESGTHGAGDTLGRNTFSKRSTSLLAFLIASQGAAFVAFTLEIAAVKVGLSTPSNSAPPPSANSGTGVSAYAVLQIFRTALMVLSITGIMSALLLHAYNAYLRPGSPGVASTADHPTILPPSVNLSRMDAITVSISTTAATLPPIEAIKQRSANDQPLLPSTDSRGICVSQDASNTGHKMPANDSRRSASASYSSSFACLSAKHYPGRSSVLYPQTIMETTTSTSRFIEMDQRPPTPTDDEYGGHGYAYIHSPTSTSRLVVGSDPLNVGLAVPSKPRQRLSIDIRGAPSQPLSSSKNAFLAGSSQDSLSGSQAPHQGSTTLETPFSASSPHRAIDIPSSRYINPYPTPRSTPTATAFTERPSTPEIPHSPAASMDALPLTRSSTRTSRGKVARSMAAYSPPSEGHCISAMDMEFYEENARTSCSSNSQHTPQRASSSTPTPIRTPTRAPTPGLGNTPFMSSPVRLRDSRDSGLGSSSRCQGPPSPPSPSSPAFMTQLKGKAKKLSSKKHETIGESLSQSFEGIRRGLGGSNGKTKYPLRSSNSTGSLGLGLGRSSSGFKFPQLTRRASDVEKVQSHRNGSCLTLAETVTVEEVEVSEEGDFMDLKDPFACSTVKKGGVLRTMSHAELGLRTGRESRIGHRESEERDRFDCESEKSSRSASYGRAKGTRMSAWGKLPVTPSRPARPASTPLMTAQHSSGPSSPTPPTPSAPKTSLRRSKNVKTRRDRKASEVGSSNMSVESSVWGSTEGNGDADIMYEEAMIAQQLLMRLDEKLWAGGSS